jgi:hypothetical protein
MRGVIIAKPVTVFTWRSGFPLRGYEAHVPAERFARVDVR